MRLSEASCMKGTGNRQCSFSTCYQKTLEAVLTREKGYQEELVNGSPSRPSSGRDHQVVFGIGPVR
jgi:hypothetical protein